MTEEELLKLPFSKSQRWPVSSCKFMWCDTGQTCYIVYELAIARPRVLCLYFIRSRLADTRQRVADEHIQDARATDVCTQEDHAHRFGLDGADNRRLLA